MKANEFIDRYTISGEVEHVKNMWNTKNCTTWHETLFDVTMSYTDSNNNERVEVFEYIAHGHIPVTSVELPKVLQKVAAEAQAGSDYYEFLAFHECGDTLANRRWWETHQVIHSVCRNWLADDQLWQDFLTITS